MIPYPDSTDFETWKAMIVEQFAIQGIPKTLAWREFGDALLNYESFPPIPRTDGFSDWRDWARYCMGFLI